jgi:hypothetical protein
MQILRRKTTEFLRLFITKYLLDVHKLSLKDTLWANSSSAVTVGGERSVSIGNPSKPSEYFSGMRMLVYTRGGSGRGRTMQNEQALVAQLQTMGANVFLCCDFNTMSLEQQLLHAYYADVVSYLCFCNCFPLNLTCDYDLDFGFAWCCDYSWHFHGTWEYFD